MADIEKNKPEFVTRDGIIADGKYVEWLGELKQRYQRSRIKTKWQQPAAKFSHQLSDELEMPEAFALIPWFHHIQIASKSKVWRRTFGKSV